MKVMAQSTEYLKCPNIITKQNKIKKQEYRNKTKHT